ncbi:MAG: FMN-binding protein [Candidatus Adiutrix sp.]|jgi:major membrane immunogen (membrane-anchored lipoprotein)|nr:FMN-binding protein [Candidatus Adiutrix sp.]
MGPGLRERPAGSRPGLWAGLALAALVVVGGCAEGPQDLLKDGYYTAEAAEFDPQGWKEFLTIYVCDGRIVSAQYNSRNSRGFLRSWDMADKRRSTQSTGTNQSKYGRAYTMALLNRQDPAQVTPIPGAAQAHPNFQRLAEAAIIKARNGDQRVAFVAF